MLIKLFLLSFCILIWLFLAFAEELRSLLVENELRIQAIQATWEYRLEEARKEWEQQYAAITQVMALQLQEACHICLEPQLPPVASHYDYYY